MLSTTVLLFTTVFKRNSICPCPLLMPLKKGCVGHCTTLIEHLHSWPLQISTLWWPLAPCDLPVLHVSKYWKWCDLCWVLVFEMCIVFFKKILFIADPCLLGSASAVTNIVTPWTALLCTCLLSTTGTYASTAGASSTANRAGTSIIDCTQDRPSIVNYATKCSLLTPCWNTTKLQLTARINSNVKSVLKPLAIPSNAMPIKKRAWPVVMRTRKECNYRIYRFGCVFFKKNNILHCVLFPFKFMINSRVIMLLKWVLV